jgi:hypothetical protein
LKRLELHNEALLKASLSDTTNAPTPTMQPVTISDTCTPILPLKRVSMPPIHSSTHPVATAPLLSSLMEQNCTQRSSDECDVEM